MGYCVGTSGGRRSDPGGRIDVTKSKPDLVAVRQRAEVVSNFTHLPMSSWVARDAIRLADEVERLRKTDEDRRVLNSALYKELGTAIDRAKWTLEHLRSLSSIIKTIDNYKRVGYHAPVDRGVTPF